MPYVCGVCDYYDDDGAHTSTCPECNGRMRFTLLDQRATVTAVLVAEPHAPAKTRKKVQPDWADPYVNGYETIEASWSFRYAQIGVGIVTYYFMWRWGRVISAIMFFTASDEAPTTASVVTFLIGMLILQCLAAIAGGAAAGLWAKNWIPQGLGVAAGVLAIPLIAMLFLAPDNWPVFLVSLVITSALTVFGAFIGHKLIPATRIPIC